METYTTKVRKLCQSGKVGTERFVIIILFLFQSWMCIYHYFPSGSSDTCTSIVSMLLTNPLTTEGKYQVVLSRSLPHTCEGIGGT